MRGRRLPELLLLATLVASPLAAAGAAEREPTQQLPARGSIELAFSPWNDPEAALAGLIGEAREQILVQAYLFTSKPLARALIDAHRRGVRVEVLFDAESNRPGTLSVLPELLNAGIVVAVETRYNIAHNKLMIVDPGSRHAAVATGSYNFTRSARVANAENLLILRDNPALAQACARNWQRHRAEALPLRSLDDLPARKGKEDGRQPDR